MDKRSERLKQLRAAVALVLVALYIAGLVLMFAGNVRLATILWVVSTLGGAGLLYWIHTMQKRQEEAEKAARGETDPEA